MSVCQLSIPVLLIILWGCAVFAYPAVLVEPLPDSLTPEEIQEAQRAIQAMKQDIRGPYLRIRWFCVDGTVHPPSGTPCRDRGGGVQHAELTPTARRLAELGLPVGSILQSLSLDQFLDGAEDYHRLKAYCLENYLFAVDDGWVLRQARYYRGARQIEDEQKTGQAFLEAILSDPEWIRRHFLLATQLVEAVPHETAVGQHSTQSIRNLASELAGLDSRFQDLRIKIHSFPSADDVAAVEGMLASEAGEGPAREKLLVLRDELRQRYDPSQRLMSLASYRDRLPVLGNELVDLQVGIQQADPILDRLAHLSLKIRQLVQTSSNGPENLLLLDLNRLIQEQAFALTNAPLQDRDFSPPRRLEALEKFFNLATGAGFLSWRERDALGSELARLNNQDTIPALVYKKALGYLARSLDWSLASVRQIFGPVQQRYSQVEPKASGFSDALIRGSILLPLSRELDGLGREADRVLGQSHHLLGRQVSHGISGLNPGLALATLEIVEKPRPGQKWDQNKIYVIPETLPELGPVAGVLSLDSGNPLSHVQLLSRSLGIPNAAIFSTLLPSLRPFQGREIFYAVSPLGIVLLKDPALLSTAERALVSQVREASSQKISLDTSRVLLDFHDPIPLVELRSTHGGSLVGPKAANLGQLAEYFPEQVATGLALPFGMYYRHVNRPFRSERTVLEEIEAAFRTAKDMKRQERTEAEIDEFMFRQLDSIREAIIGLEWIPAMRRQVVQSIRETLGEDLSHGVFVRSDTNVEDLPQFSGAGLNLTIPHQRSLEDLLVSIKRVWASPFRERAYLWRKQILEDQGRVYPSVLLLESIHSEKSGVLITSGLQAGQPEDLTVVTAEGVGGVVEGEDAETLLVDPKGNVRLLSQARAPTRQVLIQTGSGGVGRVPSSKNDTLLQDAELVQLRGVVADWKRFRQDPTTVWDIEFGFAGGKLWLFQIRPFVQYRNSRIFENLATLDAEPAAHDQMMRLRE